MSKLFIELYLDEDVDVFLAQLLRARGFRVMTTQEAKQIGSSDREQLRFAESQDRTLLTHNRVDFETLARRYYEEKKAHTGIIIATRRPPKELCRRVLRLLNEITADEIANQIRYI